MIGRVLLYSVGGGVLFLVAFFVTLRLIAPTPGAWTPIDASGAAITFSNNQSKFYVVQSVCYIYLDIVYPPGITNGFGGQIGGLPCGGDLALASGPVAGNVSGFFYAISGGITPKISIFADSGLVTPAVNAQMSGKRIVATIALF